jgi:hypothetical protein
MMASDLVTTTAEQRKIVKLLKKEKVKPEEILCRVNAQYGKETLFLASVL